MSTPSPSLSRRALILAAGVGVALSVLGTAQPARAEQEAASAQEALPQERPHRTLLGLI
ncbi:hypothetical protein [Glycomyces sp. NPDC021274]|uniref:hypothetical protein n=1 Tax=Glycomyces sp. NPDC021274 TaxID=3155120 RepID=UPI00340EBA59